MKKLISIIVLMFGFVMANSQNIIRVNPEDFPIGAPTLNTHIYSQTGGPSFKFKISAIDSLITASGLSNQNLVQVNDTTFYIDGTNDTIIITGTRQRLAVDTSSTDSVTLSISSGNAIIFSIEDLDADSTNEIQTLGLGDKTDSTQVLALSNGGLVSIQIRDADYDPTNELQDLIQLNDTSFVISGTNDTIIISSPEGTDDQIISISNDTVYLEDGGFIVLPAQTVNTDDQAISISNDTIYLEDGGFVVLPSDTFNNGINDYGSYIGLGGIFLNNTTIDLKNKDFKIIDTMASGAIFNFVIQDTSDYGSFSNFNAGVLQGNYFNNIYVNNSSGSYSAGISNFNNSTSTSHNITTENDRVLMQGSSFSAQNSIIVDFSLAQGFRLVPSGGSSYYKGYNYFSVSMLDVDSLPAVKYLNGIQFYKPNNIDIGNYKANVNIEADTFSVRIPSQGEGKSLVMVDSIGTVESVEEIWSTATRPITPFLNQKGINTNFNKWEYWDGAAWIQVN